MVRVTTIFTRPNMKIPYYMDTNRDLKIKKEIFVTSCGLITKFKKDDSDPLVQKIIVDFKDQETLQTFLQLWNEKFPTAIAERDNYCAKHNITIQRIEEVIE